MVGTSPAMTTSTCRIHPRPAKAARWCNAVMEPQGGDRSPSIATAVGSRSDQPSSLRLHLGPRHHLGYRQDRRQRQVAARRLQRLDQVLVG